MEKIMWHKVPVKEKAVAFTFDDGPNSEYTPQFLELFGKAGGKATFYMIGSRIEEDGETARAVHAQGHEIGNHTFTHPHLTEQTLEEAREELKRTDEAIRRVTGQSVPTFRPPYFDCNEQILALASEFGYRSIGACNPDTRDWEQPGVDYILEKTRPFAEPGAIFLFHDGYGDRSQTAEAVRILLEELSAEGYRFVTVSELLAMAE